MSEVESLEEAISTSIDATNISDEISNQNPPVHDHDAEK